MSNIGISDTSTNQINANIITPGPTGSVGDMKTNPSANPNISQNDVGSTRHTSMEATDSTNTSTKAYENMQNGKELPYNNDNLNMHSATSNAVISNEVGSLKHTSIEATDSTNTSTKAYENTKKITEQSSDSIDPDVHRAISKAVISNDVPVRLDSSTSNANPPVASSYGN